MATYKLEAPGKEASFHSLKKGDVLEVHLEENPSTGYSWEFVSLPSSILVEAEEYTPSVIQGPDTPPEMLLVGGGGTVKYQLRVLEDVAEAEILLHYTRPWDKSDIARQVNLKIGGLEGLEIL